jgi:HlyD family secretion protein
MTGQDFRRLVLLTTNYQLKAPRRRWIDEKSSLFEVPINQLFAGQRAILRFSSFSQRTTPEITGEVSLISADLTQDQRTGVNYYMVRITPNPDQLAQLGAKLIPGMSVEAFVQTGGRTAFSYLIKPIRDQAARAFTEK